MSIKRAVASIFFTPDWRYSKRMGFVLLNSLIMIGLFPNVSDSAIALKIFNMIRVLNTAIVWITLIELSVVWTVNTVIWIVNEFVKRVLKRYKRYKALFNYEYDWADTFLAVTCWLVWDWLM